MSLQSVSLLDLAAIRESNVLNAEYVGVVVSVWRYLTFRGELVKSPIPCSRDYNAPQYREITSISLRMLSSAARRL